MSDALQRTNRLTQDPIPPFVEWPRWFAMRCHGTCLEPVIPDGSNCIFDKEASYEAGDFVAIWVVKPGGIIVPFVKRLVMNVALWARFPHVLSPHGEIVPVVVFETLNPPQHFRADARTIHDVHKCIGFGPRIADVPNGTEIFVHEGDVHWFKKPRRKQIELA